MIGHPIRNGAEEPLAHSPFVRRPDDDEIVFGGGFDDALTDVVVGNDGDFSGDAHLFQNVAHKIFIMISTN